MSNIHRLPRPQDVEREASLWLARLNADDVSSDDRARFAAWLQQHPSHGRAYSALGGTWQELERSGPIVRAVYFGQAMIAAGVPPQGRSRVRIVALVACVALLALGFSWYRYRHPDQTEFQAAVGEQTTVSLPDGSSFTLNSNSLAHVEYTGRRRIVVLERGEAFFRVVHNPKRPFWVHAGSSWVRDIGTEFNVDMRGARVVVTVREGIVKVLTALSSAKPPADPDLIHSAASITAGEQVNIIGRAEILHTLPPQQLSRLLAWRTGSLYFQDQPLGEVADELMRYTRLKIQFSDPQLRQLRVGGTFRTSPAGAQALLSMLHDGFGMRIRRVGHNRVEVLARPK
ncbi:MAG: FecR family protein [Steroidobacteraceae bacterium]